MRKTLLGSFIGHVVATIVLVRVVAFGHHVQDVPRQVYEVTLVAAAQGANAESAARMESAPPVPVEAAHVEAVPSQTPAPAAVKTASVQVNKVNAAAPAHVKKAVAGVNNGRFANDSPGGSKGVGDAGLGAGDEVEARGSPVPLRMTHPSSYSETYVILHAVNPAYPEHERERGIEGTVTVELLVDEQGMVANVNVLELVGPESFRTSALDAVRQFEFQPPIENGVPSTMWIKFVIKFRING